VIVLDEQLLGRNLDKEIAKWYRGKVLFINDLRPNTVIKDEAIPYLLRQDRQATFITINVSDFWEKAKADKSFCIVCFALSDARVNELPSLMRRLFRQPAFRTKRSRVGKIVRATQTTATYYAVKQPKPVKIDF
jgi:hypothetical protein